MAFDILINTKDTYLYSLIEWQLSHIFPDAYIRMASDAATNTLSSFITYVYDNRYITNPPTPNSIKLFSFINEHPIVDCEVIANKVSEQKENRNHSNTESSTCSTNPQLTILVSLVYPDDRELFISKNLCSLITVDHMCIRLNFVWGAYLASSDYSGLSTGAMTALLNKAKEKISPSEILEYLNPDNQGFLNPGPTDNPDDICEASDQAINNLLSAVNQLLIDENGNFNCLAVIDGGRTKDIVKYIPFAKKVLVLLPDKQLINHEALDELIKSLSKHLSPSSTLSIHYSTDYKETINEQHL